MLPQPTPGPAQANGANHVEFYYEAVKQNFLSEQEGRPVFKQEPFIRITVPGGKHVVIRKVRNEDKQMYPQLWAAFEAGQERPKEGLPVEEWPQLTVDMVATLKAVKIYTVEQLAALSDGELSYLGMEGRKLRDQAKAFLEVAEDGKALSKYVSENERLKSEVERLSKLVEDLAARVDEQPKPKNRRKKEPLDGIDDTGGSSESD